MEFVYIKLGNVIVLDSFGKPPSGILRGALIWPGDFQECVASTEESTSWTSKYCQLENVLKSVNTTDFTIQSKLIFKYGACMPYKCSENDIASIFNQCKPNNFLHVT